MRFLAITGCALLVVCASATASNTRVVQQCSQSKLRMTVQSQGESSTAWIGVIIRNRQARCSLAGVMTIKIVRDGRLVKAAGNPLRVHVSGFLSARGSYFVRADWSNWCGKRSGLRLLVAYAGRASGLRFAYSPRCINRQSPSRLIPIH
jgi:hypothetical protein